MAYIGKDPAEAYQSFVKQDFSTSATTSYTLDNAVTNENELALFINFVRQEPTTAYTASGTTLTLTSATASGDDMYCLYLGQAKQTVNAPDGSVGTTQLAADAVTEAKIADNAVENEHLNANVITGQTAETSIATDDTILIHDTSASALRKMTRANFISGVGGTNTPAFMAYNAADQSISDATVTQITWTESYDSDNAFASNTFTVPTGEGGKYWIGSNVQVYNTAGNISMFIVYVMVNGSQAMYIREHVDSNAWYQKGINVNGILNLSAGDAVTVSVYIDHSSGSSQANDTASETFFTGYKLIT